MLIKLDDTPGQYVFEVHVGNDGEVGKLEVNYWSINAAIRNAGVTDAEYEDPSNQPDLVKRVADAARPMLRPKEIVDQMSDVEVFVKVNQAGILDKKLEARAGEVPEPSPT